MEISKITQTGIRVKTKLTSFAVTPFSAKGKVIADYVLFYSKKTEDLPNFELQPLLITGPGEYEIKGAKLTGTSKKDSLIYFGKMDGIDVVLMQASAALKGKEMVNECQLAIIDAESELDESTLNAFGASTIVLYGEFAESSAKKTGKNIITGTKYITTKDKLPTETEVVVLS